MKSFGFHPIITEWFQTRFEAPTQPQQLGWPCIASGAHTLIAAPTGSGKTYAAFLACIDRLFRMGQERPLEDAMHVVYISPLRALSNDMHRNLEQPLQEIAQFAGQAGSKGPEIRVGLRTGDTSSSRRAALVRRPPQILVTTPESLYLLLTSLRGREALRTVNTVIVDEIHALVRDKRGSHLALSLERLEALVRQPLQRIGLSATQKPIERIAEFLVGHRDATCHVARLEPPALAAGVEIAGEITRDDSPAPDASAFGSSFETKLSVATAVPDAPRCEIVDVGHARALDLAIEVPPTELGAVCTHEQWAEVDARLVQLINEHRSTLIFVNTRRMAERVTHHLTERLGEDVVGSHHGSLSAKIRLDTERRLKSGQLKAVVATASLELGIDVGYIDLVIQLGSPRSIAAFLQRIGRSGHALGLVPKGRIFALSRDELLESMALIRAIGRGRLDSTQIPTAPLDILAQQIVAELVGREWTADELFRMFRQADPYRDLNRHDFDRTLEYLSEGISHDRGRSRALIFHDRVGGRIKARKAARIIATSNGGAIPETGSFRVVTDPEGTVVGSLDEDFAIESSAGDIFLLGNTSWRILYVRGGDVTVADAQGAPPTVPFWRGEAPGRTLELSDEISKLKKHLESVLDTTDTEALVGWLSAETHCSSHAAQQAVTYVAAQKVAMGVVPTQDRVVFERFFDDTGGMQLVVHAPFGGDICRAWALAMRKRFCVSFDFELQASADDNGFVLSLGPQHSFPIESLFPMLTRENARELTEQSLLFHPMFQMRWRWNVTRALLVDRMRSGKKVPPPLQRFRADDLLSAVFPKLTGCQEEHSGAHEIPDHPLIQQTVHDCLHESLDLNGFYDVLDQIQQGKITLLGRDTREPSPFAYELLNANVYAFLDGGEIQERRARAVSGRRSVSVEEIGDLAWLDPEAIQRVRLEARPQPRDADELHDVLLSRIVLPSAEVSSDWLPWMQELAAQRRVTTLVPPGGEPVWVSAERLPVASAVFPNARCSPVIEPPDGVRTDWTAIEGRIAMVRGAMEERGPCTAEHLADSLSLNPTQVFATLEALEGEGCVLRGTFERNPHEISEEESLGAERAEKNSAANEPDARWSLQWCHRRLLARIHRLTVQGLRREIEPVGVEDYLRYLLKHHGIGGKLPGTGSNAVFNAVAMLQGIDLPAVCWEREVLCHRIANYRADWLDELCLSGELGWGRLFPPTRDAAKSRPMSSLTRAAPISLWLRSDLDWLLSHARQVEAAPAQLSTPAQQVCELLEKRGAMFASDIAAETIMVPAQLDEVLGELVSRGLVTADGFAGLRERIAARRVENHRRRPGIRRARQRSAGRWSLWRPTGQERVEESGIDAVEQWAWQLLRRWGVIFRDLLKREQGAPPWFRLLQVYRRLEARGEIRGGRFVKGVGGEQFAVGETVRELRSMRDTKAAHELIVISAADPLNLVGVVTGHPRVPSLSTGRVALLDGRPVAALHAGDCRWLADDLASEQQIRVRAALKSAFLPSQDEPSLQPRTRPHHRPRHDKIPRPLIR